MERAEDLEKARLIGKALRKKQEDLEMKKTEKQLSSSAWISLERLLRSYPSGKGRQFSLGSQGLDP